MVFLHNQLQILKDYLFKDLMYDNLTYLLLSSGKYFSTNSVQYSLLQF